MMVFLGLLLLGTLLIIEISLFYIVKLLRTDFQWLITLEDEYPEFDPTGLNSFFSKSFDPTLGWVRRSCTSGVEKGEKGEVLYYIDSIGSRTNSNSTKYIPTIACFGDSYAFCRQVENDETWEYYLSDLINTGVLNFGVGNYGFDQALIRYRNMDLPDSVEYVIMAVVPETICRIQSYWKHYLEFGNTFAFKPRFVMEKGKLKLLSNPMQNEKDFFKYREKLPFIQKNDRFYKEKFRKCQFRFPYCLSFMRKFDRNLKVFYALIKRSLIRAVGKYDYSIEDQPFRYIMEDNIKAAHRLYEEKKSQDLFRALILDYCNYATSKGHKPILLVIPQLVDIYHIKKYKIRGYSEFMNNMNIKQMNILDVTSQFIRKADTKEYYVNDKYGGHISKVGNKYIAQRLLRFIK